MRESSLRWGLALGIVASVLGIAALLIGTLLTPKGAFPPAEVVATAYFIQGALVLLALGGSLSLAYVAGYRSELSRPRTPGESSVAGRRDALLAGIVVMVCYWVLTTVYLLMLSIVQHNFALGTFLANRVILAVLSLVFGAGMGAMGGRAPAARTLLARLTQPALTSDMVPAVSPAASPALATDAGETAAQD